MWETNHMSPPETNQIGFKILNEQAHDYFDRETNQETNQISPNTNDLSHVPYGIDGETYHLYQEKFDLSPERTF
jgi:hypothetical protein